MPPPDILPTAIQLRAALSRLQRELRAGPSRGDMLSNSALSVLSQLYRLGPLPAAQIARLEHVRPQSLTRALADLEAAGLVARSNDPADARRQLLSLTTDGARALTDEAHRREASLAGAIAARLTAPERARLRAACGLMDRIADRLAQAAEDAASPKAAPLAGKD